MAPDQYDLVIVGMGSAGMAAAEFAVDARTARGRDRDATAWAADRCGPDACPSKALLASARVAHSVRHADRFGIDALPIPTSTSPGCGDGSVDVQASIAATDDHPDRYEAMGLEIVHGDARLTGPNEVTVAACRRCRRTGAADPVRPAVHR